MNLRDWMDSKEITINEFAKTLGCSTIHLYGIRGGLRWPSTILANAIVKITQGEVSFEELTKGKPNRKWIKHG